MDNVLTVKLMIKQYKIKGLRRRYVKIVSNIVMDDWNGQNSQIISVNIIQSFKKVIGNRWFQMFCLDFYSIYLFL